MHWKVSRALDLTAVLLHVASGIARGFIRRQMIANRASTLFSAKLQHTSATPFQSCIHDRSTKKCKLHSLQRLSIIAGGL